MEDGSRISWLIQVILLLLCAMFFALTETAYSSVSKVRVKTLSDKGDSRAKRALYILDNFERAITTLLICTNIVHILVASIVTVHVTKQFGVGKVFISTIITTIVVFFLGEMLPKSIGRKYNEKITLATSFVLRILMKILYPVSSILTFIGNQAAKLTKGDEVSVTEEELYDIIEDLTEEGSLDENQGDLISSALQFQDVSVESILTSRVDLVSIDVDMSQEEILKIIKEEGHSRLPVYEETIDHIIGVLQIRKYIKAVLAQGHIEDIRPLLDKPYFVHQSAKIDDVLNTMSTEKMNVAIVTDNYGGTVGIVTVEDILEELVGEIWDEDDNIEENIIKLSDDTYSVNADDLVTDVLDELGIDYDEETSQELENKLLSELVYETFSQIPQENDFFQFLNTVISVQIMEQNRIKRVKVKVLKKKGDK